MSITGPTFVFTISLEQQLKHCMCSSAEWTSDNLWTSMALNVQHVPVQRGFKLEDSGTPPPPITQSQKNKLPFTMTTAMERDIDK